MSQKALKNGDTDEAINCAVVNIYSEICGAGKDVIFFWIPSHIGIDHNHLTDEAATLPEDNIVAGPGQKLVWQN